MKVSARIPSVLLVALATLATTGAAPPAAPQNVQQAWLGVEAFLFWDETAGATGYNVYRSDGVNTTWTQVATNLALPLWRDVMPFELPSFYVVGAVNAEGEGDLSELATVTNAPAFMIWLDVIHPWYQNVTQTNAIVHWWTSSPGDQGLVEWGAAEPDATNFTFLLINTNYLFDHTFILTNLAPGTIYNYRVTSINGWRGGMSATRSFSTVPTNHPPLITYELYTNMLPIGVLFSIMDTDQPPQSVTFEIIPPTNGTLLTPWQQWGPNGPSWGTYYQPNPGARGLDSFTITATDGVDAAVPAVITVSNWLNRLPDVSYRTVTALEDTPTAITLPHPDPDGDPLTYEIVGVWGGTLSGTPPFLTYTPNSNSITWGSLWYIVSDGYASTNGYMTIEVVPVNDPPVAFPVSVTTWEDHEVTVSPSFIDIEGGSFAVQLVRPPDHGTVSVLQDYHLQYTPAPDFHGLDSFEYAVAEPDGTTSQPALVVIDVMSFNDPPVLSTQTVYTAENVAVNVTLMAMDPDGDPLTYSVYSGPFNGTLSGTPPNVLYTPNPDFIGYDYISYSADDGFASRANTQTIGVGVNSLAPVQGLRRRTYLDGIVRLWWPGVPGAVHYNVYRADGSNAPFTLLAAGVTATNFNDSTAQWQQPYWYRVRSWDGALEGQPSGSVFARPDGSGVLNLDLPQWSIHSTTGRVQFYSSILGGTEGIFEYGTDRNYGVFLENTNILPFHRFAISNLTPTTIYYFRIIATDASGNATVASTNLFQDWFATETPPLATAQALSTAEDVAVNITLAGQDQNYFFHPLTFSIVSGPAHGTLSGSGANRTYTPALNYHGPDSFTFKVNNGELDSVPATVSLTVFPVNDAPVVSNFSFSTAEDVPAIRPALFTDAEGGTMTVYVATPPSHGSVMVAGTNLLYLPATNYNGTDWYSYLVYDGQSFGNTATVTIGITPVNDRPLASPQSVVTPEDVPLLVSPVGFDADGDTLSLQAVTLPAHGTLSLASPGLLYTPTANYHGPDSFTAKTFDGVLPSLTITISITVTSVNDRPTASGLSGGVFEDTPQTLNLGGYDPDGDTLTATVLTQPAHGTLSGTGSTRTYLPATNYAGPDSFTFLVNDGSTDSAPATVSLTIVGLNDAPIAGVQAVSVPEDTATAFTLSATDVDSGTLTYTVLTLPTHGVLSGTAPNVTYTPAGQYHGPDSLTFSVSDGSLSSTGLVNITVTSINDPPVAAPQAVSTAEDAAVGVTLAGSDLDGDALSFAIVSGPAHGTITGTGANRIYTPEPNYHGADSFTFVANDGWADSEPVGVSLTITPVNDAPVADALTVSTPEDTTLNITLTGSDIEGSPLSFVVTAQPSHGTLSGTAPNLSYTPEANFHGADTITYTVSDGTAESEAASVTIQVIAVNDPPVAQPDSVTVAEDGSVLIPLTAADLEGDALTYEVVTGPAHGVLTGSGASRTYIPAANYNGPDSFTFMANDGALDSAPVTVGLTVTAVNDAPVANPQSVSTPYNIPVNITLTGSDVEGSGLTYTTLTSPANGTLSGTGASRTFTPAIGWSGTTTFTFQVNDGALNSPTATVTIIVAAAAAVPPAPSGLAATAISRTQINLTWTESATGEDGFKIERSTSATSGWAQIATVGPNVTVYSSVGLTKNTTYYYRVRAYNALGNSPYSNTASAKTLK